MESIFYGEDTLHSPMSPRERLFQVLQDAAGVRTLLGTNEDVHLECKAWSANEGDAQKGMAKAICGMANADGGVIVIGLSTKTNADKYKPDVIDLEVPVTDVVALQSRLAGLVPDLVEPSVAGVTITGVRASDGTKSGFVILDVPPTDGPPCRSRKDWRFYQRINSGTYLMEYFQLEAMFGKRMRPVLRLYVEEGRYRLDGQMYQREFTIGIENSGRGLAKFPSLRFVRLPGVNIGMYGIDGQNRHGLPLRPTEPEIIVFGGGADDVIYPGTTLKVARMDHRAKVDQSHPAREGTQRSYFEQLEFKVALSADGVPTFIDSKVLPERFVS